MAIAFSPGSYTEPAAGDGVPVMEIVIDERAYLPVNGWEPAAPDALRRQALAGGLLLSAVVIVGLLAPKRRVLAVVVAASVGTAGVVAWSVTRPTVSTLSGSVWQADVVHAWTWYQSPTPTVLNIPADRRTFVVAYDRSHLATLTPVVRVDAAGRIEGLTLTLPADVPAAVVRVGAGAPTPGTGLSPLRPMVRKLYLRPGVEIVAEGAGGVVLE